MRNLCLSILVLTLVWTVSAGGATAITWTIESVDTTPYAYQGVELTLDTAGRPHASYGSFGFGMRYAYRDGSGWHQETIEGAGGVGYSDTALVLDGAGQPHISYYDYTHGLLKYAYYAGTAWVTATVDTCMGDTALVLAANQPRIAYFGPGNHLNYAHLAGGTWYTETVASSAEIAGPLALVLDSGDEPHILYQLDGLRYAYHDGTGWHSEVVDSYAAGGDLVLDSLDQPRASFAGFCEGGGVGPWGLCYAYRDGGGWHIASVDVSGDTGWYSSLALDTGDHPHISYYAFANQDLHYAAISGTVWLTETVDSQQAGLYSALAVAGSGRVHIAYEGDSTLKYAFGVGAEAAYQVYLPRIERW